MLGKFSGQWRPRKASGSARIRQKNLDLDAVLREAEARGMDRRKAMERLIDPDYTSASQRLDVCLAAMREACRGR